MPALGLICLQLFLSAHLALERHAVSTEGELVEVGSWNPSHAHDDDRSLCDAGAVESAWPDVQCEALLEGLTVDEAAEATERLGAADPGVERTQAVWALPRAVWRYAPKASPPAA